jgi:hypothetical protein
MADPVLTETGPQGQVVGVSARADSGACSLLYNPQSRCLACRVGVPG